MARGNRKESAWADSSDIDAPRLELLEGFLNRSEISTVTSRSTGSPIT
jgi:hypothetical protein